MYKIKKMVFFTIMIGTIGLGLIVGSVWAQYNMTPTSVNTSSDGVQINYSNGSGYWLEY